MVCFAPRATHSPPRRQQYGAQPEGGGYSSRPVKVTSVKTARKKEPGFYIDGDCVLSEAKLEQMVAE